MSRVILNRSKRLAVKIVMAVCRAQAKQATDNPVSLIERESLYVMHIAKRECAARLFQKSHELEEHGYGELARAFRVYANEFDIDAMALREQARNVRIEFQTDERTSDSR